MKFLFLIRKRTANWGYGSTSSGLFNSVAFIVKMLEEAGHRAKLVEVSDANCIDRETFQYDPHVVILEAIWCPPSKLVELTSLHHHKHRRWIVRNHSELPFLAAEGIALEWMLQYPFIPRVHIACNSPTATSSFNDLILSMQPRAPGHWWYDLFAGAKSPVFFLPNYYQVPKEVRAKKIRGLYLEVGCFGAIRPLKNHLQQAVAAIAFARSIDRPLRFHINATRMEGNGEPILKSLRGLFAATNNTTLVEHPWVNHHDFKKLCTHMDIGLQVSFSETFNIVAADLITAGVPVVTSASIPWMPKKFHADPTSVKEIGTAMGIALKSTLREELRALRDYVSQSKLLWVENLPTRLSEF